MKKLFVFAIALLTASACVRTHKGNPYVPSIDGSWLVTDLTATAEGEGAEEAKAELLEIFDGFMGFTLVFNHDGTVVIPEGTEAYALTDPDLWIDRIAGARIMFTVDTLTGTEMELTCDALTGIDGPVAFPPGVTSLSLYLRGERR